MFECVSFQEVQGKAPGTVVVVSKIGYKLHDRVIRPALVGVAKGPQVKYNLMTSDITLGGGSLLVQTVIVSNMVGMVVKYCGYEVNYFD